MSTGIPLEHLNNKSILAVKKHTNFLIYKINSSRLFRKYSIVDASLIIKAIRFLKASSSLYFHAREVNRIIKRIFSLALTTKTIEAIYYFIFTQKIAFTFNKNAFLCKDSFASPSKLDNIILVNDPLLNINKILSYIASFNNLVLNATSLAQFRQSSSYIEKTIAFLVQDFFKKNENQYKNLHQLTSFLNSNLKQMGIDYKATCRIQKRIFLQIFKSNLIA
ncbi:hypothetical protein [Borrelia sp. A-FGy1]|uniref:hypothetical protein n=1 Tax=Borrelia sp. A-FGy1 TaxID=2608247 RepID=UPI0015F65E5E|nr:hypothetical protein [Borrelia sp. A-FGy1]